MEDRFLHDLRRAPSPEFAARLRVRLGDQPAHARRRSPSAAWLAAAATLAAVSVALTFPEIRAGAAAFLDMFRVVNFAAVRFDPERLAGLKAGGVDMPGLLGDVQPLNERAAPVSYADPEEAGRAAGIDARLPTWLPPDWTLRETLVTPEHGARVTANAAKLQAVLDALALDDVRLPQGLDGQVATVRLPPVVAMAFGNGARSLRVIEAQSAEVTFPAGFDLAALAEVALRILGLPRDEAYRMATTIDWRNTLVVPVPVDAASFREVNVAGANGLLIERESGARVLLWSSGGQMYAVSGPLGAAQLLEVAQSLQ